MSHCFVLIFTPESVVSPRSECMATSCEVPQRRTQRADLHQCFGGVLGFFGINIGLRLAQSEVAYRLGRVQILALLESAAVSYSLNPSLPPTPSRQHGFDAFRWAYPYRVRYG